MSRLKKSKMSYEQAVEWIVLNDPPESLHDEGHISSCLVADLFGLSVGHVLSDVQKLAIEMDGDNG